MNYDKGVIYKITSPSGRVYIGQTKTIKKRLQKYRCLNCKTQRLLYRSLLAHGFNNHHIDIVESCDASMLDDREVFWIAQLQCNKNKYQEGCGLNLSDGGQGNKGCVRNSVRAREASRRNVKIAQLSNVGKSYRTGMKHSQASIELMCTTKADRRSGCKLILNIDTGVYYTGVVEAAASIGVSKPTLSNRLRGRVTNNTPLRYV